MDDIQLCLWRLFKENELITLLAKVPGASLIVTLDFYFSLKQMYGDRWTKYLYWYPNVKIHVFRKWIFFRFISKAWRPSYAILDTAANIDTHLRL